MDWIYGAHFCSWYPTILFYSSLSNYISNYYVHHIGLRWIIKFLTMHTVIIRFPHVQDICHFILASQLDIKWEINKSVMNIWKNSPSWYLKIEKNLRTKSCTWSWNEATAKRSQLGGAFLTWLCYNEHQVGSTKLKVTEVCSR